MGSIVDFVASARARGIDDDTIRSAMLDQGWKDSEITLAMSGLETPKPVVETAPVSPVIAPALDKEQLVADVKRHDQRPSLSPLIAALHHIFLLFFTIASTFAIGAAVLSAFDISTSAQALSSFMAVFIVTMSVYLGFYIPFVKRTLKEPYVTASRVWSIITICMHGIAGMISAITLLVMFINGGSVEWRTIFGLILFLNIAVVATYVAATFIKPTLPLRRIILLTVIPLVVVVMGALFIRSFVGLVDVRHDDAVRADLLQTATNIREYVDDNDKLPTEASSLIEGSNISYSKLSDKQYELCADFKTGSLSNLVEPNKYSVDDSYLSEYDFDSNKKGNSCFKIESSSLKYDSYDRYDY